MSASNTTKTETVNVSATIETIAAKIEINPAYIADSVEFIKGGLTIKAFDIVSCWTRAGRIFSKIKEVYAKKEFNKTVNEIFGEKLSKDNRAYSMKLAALDFDELKEWYIQSEIAVTSPKRVYTMFTSTDEEKQENSDFVKAMNLIKSLKSKCEKGEFVDDEFSTLSNELSSLAVSVKANIPAPIIEPVKEVKAEKIETIIEPVKEVKAEKIAAKPAAKPAVKKAATKKAAKPAKTFRQKTAEKNRRKIVTK